MCRSGPLFLTGAGDCCREKTPVPMSKAPAEEVPTTDGFMTNNGTLVMVLAVVVASDDGAVATIGVAQSDGPPFEDFFLVADVTLRITLINARLFRWKFSCAYTISIFSPPMSRFFLLRRTRSFVRLICRNPQRYNFLVKLVYFDSRKNWGNTSLTSSFLRRTEKALPSSTQTIGGDGIDSGDTPADEVAVLYPCACSRSRCVNISINYHR